MDATENQGCSAPADVRGQFVWYELLTEDCDKAAAFYGKVIGWTAESAGMPGMDYRLFKAGDIAVCGFMSRNDLPGGANMPIHWMGYVAVTDADQMAATVKRAGGQVHFEPHDISGVGRFAICGDPQGAGFAVMAEPEANSRQRLQPQKPGHGCWHEYHGTDWEKAFDFYAGLFGWTKAEAMDMGPEGTYQLWGVHGGMLGGMMNAPAHSPHRGWLYYFGVPNLDTSMAAVTASGGTVLFGPQEVPGGASILQCRDDQGVLFALIGPRA